MVAVAQAADDDFVDIDSQRAASETAALGSLVSPLSQLKTTFAATGCCHGKAESSVSPMPVAAVHVGPWMRAESAAEHRFVTRHLDHHSQSMT